MNRILKFSAYAVPVISIALAASQARGAAPSQSELWTDPKVKKATVECYDGALNAQSEGFLKPGEKRRFEAVRSCVDTLRLFAGEHDGRLPNGFFSDEPTDAASQVVGRWVRDGLSWDILPGKDRMEEVVDMVAGQFR